MLIDVAYAAESSAAPGVAATLGLNPELFAFQLINFAVVVLIVWFLILKPVTKKMTERQKLIDASLDNAKLIEANAKKSELEFQRRVDEAKVEANRILENVATEGAALKADLKREAAEEIAALAAAAKANLANDRAATLKEIKIQAADLIASALEKILSARVDVGTDRALIEEMIAKLK